MWMTLLTSTERRLKTTDKSLEKSWNPVTSSWRHSLRQNCTQWKQHMRELLSKWRRPHRLWRLFSRKKWARSKRKAHYSLLNSRWSTKRAIMRCWISPVRCETSKRHWLDLQRRLSPTYSVWGIRLTQTMWSAFQRWIFWKQWFKIWYTPSLTRRNQTSYLYRTIQTALTST